MTGGHDLVVGVDCSTTAAKAVVWDRGGRAVAQGRATFTTSSARPGWGEQNAEDWWTATREAIRRAAQSTDARRIAAIAITHQRETFACVTEDGRPLRPAMLWLDTRATAEVAEFGTPEVHRVTGKPPNPTPAWYKLLWLRRHEPETLAPQRARRRRAGLPRAPAHRALAHVVGERGPARRRRHAHLRLRRRAARRGGPAPARSCPSCTSPARCSARSRPIWPTSWTSRHGLPVVAGVGDGQSAGLGTGVVEPGSAYLNLGTGIISGTYSETYSTGMEFRVLSGAVPRTYVFETFIGGGTYNISWFVEKFSGVDPMALGLGLSAEQVLETAAAQLPPGADGLLVLPYWTGALTPYWDSNARGVVRRADRGARQGARLPRAAGGPGVRAAAAHRRGGSVAGEADRAARHPRRRLTQRGVVPDHRRRPAPSAARRPRDREHLSGLGHARRGRGRAAPDPAGGRHGHVRHRRGVPAGPGPAPAPTTGSSACTASSTRVCATCSPSWPSIAEVQP